MELHLRRADRIIQGEIAQERAERRSPQFKPLGIGFPGNNEYIGISDAAVPEPSSLTLLGSSVAGLALILWWYRSRPRSWTKESTEHLSLARK
jgi:hypothetical protein